MEVCDDDLQQEVLLSPAVNGVTPTGSDQEPAEDLTRHEETPQLLFPAPAETKPHVGFSGFG